MTYEENVEKEMEKECEGEDKLRAIVVFAKEREFEDIAERAERYLIKKGRHFENWEYELAIKKLLGNNDIQVAFPNADYLLKLLPEIN